MIDDPELVARTILAVTNAEAVGPQAELRFSVLVSVAVMMPGVLVIFSLACRPPSAQSCRMYQRFRRDW